jgi:hypothetical protein
VFSNLISKYRFPVYFRTFARANKNTRPVTTAQQPHAGWAGMRSEMSAQIAADLAVEAARHVAKLRRAAK